MDNVTRRVRIQFEEPIGGVREYAIVDADTDKLLASGWVPGRKSEARAEALGDCKRHGWTVVR